MKIKADSLGEEKLGKLGEEKDEEEEPATERRREYTDVGSVLGERETSTLGSRDVRLMIFITCMSGSKSLMPFSTSGDHQV